jgi:hypothetical protein
LTNTVSEFSDAVQINPADSDSDTFDTDGSTSASAVFFMESITIPDGQENVLQFKMEVIESGESVVDMTLPLTVKMSMENVISD